MNRPGHFHKSGFTLVELLMALMICVALMTALSFAAGSAIDIFHANQSHADLQHRCRMLMMRLGELTRTTIHQRPGDSNPTTQANEWNDFQTNKNKIGKIPSKGIIFSQEIPQSDGSIRYIYQQFSYFGEINGVNVNEVRLRTATSTSAESDPASFLESEKPTGQPNSWQTVLRGVKKFQATLFIDVHNPNHRINNLYHWTSKVDFEIDVESGQNSAYTTSIEKGGTAAGFKFKATFTPTRCAWTQTQTQESIATALAR